jgi:hypothetical protein
VRLFVRSRNTLGMFNPAHLTPIPPFYPRRLGLALIVKALAAALFVVGFQPAAHVTHAANGSQKPTSWVWLDYISGTPDNGEGSFAGYLVLPTSRTLWIANTVGADVVLTLDGQEVYRGTESAQITLDDALPSVVAFHFNYRWQGAFPPRGHIGLFQEGLAGIRSIVSPWQFVTGNFASNIGFLHVVRVLSLVLMLLSLVFTVAALRLSRRLWLGLGLVFSLSLVVHLITLAEKFGNDPGIWTMATVWDNYVLMGRGWLAGTVPVGGQLYQQGNFIYLGLLQQVIGPDLAGLYLFNTVIGSFGAVFVLLAGWALFDRATGYTAGIMTAAFAPLIHYQHTLQVVAPSALLLCILAAAVAGLYRWRHIVFAIAAGLAVGLAGVFQGTVLVLGLLPLWVVFLQKSLLRTKAIYSVAVLAAAAFVIAPITITNFRAGFHVLTANLADYQLFRSNNRNSMGLNTWMTPSEQLALARGDDQNWMQALLRDTQHDRWRIVELTIRRIALFWDFVEHSDSGMTDYVTTGLDVSPTLRLLSLGGAANFRVLMILASVGLAVGVWGRRQRWAALTVAAGLLIYMAALAGFYVIGRVRLPAVPFVILLAAVGLTVGYRALRWGTRAERIALLGAIAAALTVTWLADTLANTLPRPELISANQLPADLVPVEGVYNNEIKLLGYAFYETDGQSGGYLTFELFWLALAQPSKDYVTTVRFVNTRTQAIDHHYNFTLGAQGDPDWPSTRWTPGDILQERYFITLPIVEADDLPAYHLVVGLYSTGDEQLATLTDANVEVADDHLRLTGLGLSNEPVSKASTDEPVLVWADMLALQSVDCQANQAGVTLEMIWFIRQRPTRDKRLFVHVLSGDSVVAQRDAWPQADVPIDAWRARTRYTTTWQFEEVTGPVTIRLGFYDSFTQERWPITASNELAVQDNYVEFACAGRLGG